MKIFRCDHCGQLIFFENSICTRCGHTLAFLPDRRRMAALTAHGEALWTIATPDAPEAGYRLCANYRNANVCNWAMPAADEHELCPSCRLTRVIPDLDVAGHAEAWYRLEIAKRRLLYTLLELRLPIHNRDDDPEHGLAFDFLADQPEDKGGAVLTGHANGVITINVAEADNAEREKRRAALHEPYRTLLGHFRHEIGHYYWDVLIADSPRLAAFRERFGDERADYAQALKAHYERAPDDGWQSAYVSAYASSHPWEDWAETWAHYLHIVDTLQIAGACGISLEDAPMAAATPVKDKRSAFDELMERWYPLTFALNSLNRAMGLSDGYPFALSTIAIDKLRFIHDTIADRERAR